MSVPSMAGSERRSMSSTMSPTLSVSRMAQASASEGESSAVGSRCCACAAVDGDRRLGHQSLDQAGERIDEGQERQRDDEVEGAMRQH